MNIVITMGGLGTRFQKAGYNIPKYQITVKEKTLFEWSMISLKNFFQYKFVFVVRKTDDAVLFIKEKCEKLKIYDFLIVELDRVTSGQAETASIAINECELEDSVLIYNIDTYVNEEVLTPKNIVGDGFIPCFNAPGTHWSFVKLNSIGKVIEVVEKKRISNNCTIGAYYFSSCQLYKRLYAEYYLKLGNLDSGERYIAPMYNLLIENGGDIFIQIIDEKYVHVLGTPEEVEVFKLENKKTVDAV